MNLQHKHSMRGYISLIFFTLLTSCGGGSSGGFSFSSKTVADKPTQAQAARFLTQSTFGPTMADITSLPTKGYSAWFSQQFALTPSLMEPVIAARYGKYVNGTFSFSNEFQVAWWPQAVYANDQLRQRLTFALSEIFVISLAHSTVNFHPIAAANYYDMLTKDSFGNYRQILKDVTLHPLMGIYLSWINNKKETYDANGNVVRSPDENYAREIMQLFSIGLTQLNQDGTEKLDSNGKTIPTYSHDDIFGLAKVFTGWTYDASKEKAICDGVKVITNCDDGFSSSPMIPSKPQDHSTSSKKFLGTIIPANNAPSAASMRAELNKTLDIIFNHPNTPPFISKQLIQRLVTSNPSPGYVKRVADVFTNNGSGVRGDMKAVVKAILMDPEAHDANKSTNAKFGKIREPVLRYTNWLRSFNVKAFDQNGVASPRSLIQYYSIEDQIYGLGQAPLYSPTVFNFFRPGYILANSNTSKVNLLAPELQTTNAQSIVTYQNFMQRVIDGDGVKGDDRVVIPDYTAEQALATNVDKLLDRLNLLLMQGQMQASLGADVKAAVEAMPSTTDNQKKNRVYAAVFLLMASPEYIVQK